MPLVILGVFMDIDNYGFSKILDSFVLLLIMGVLSRPFSLIGLILKEKKTYVEGRVCYHFLMLMFFCYGIYDSFSKI